MEQTVCVYTLDQKKKTNMHVYILDQASAMTDAKKQHAGPGQKTSIECRFDGNPKPRVMWTHNGSDVNWLQV